MIGIKNVKQDSVKMDIITYDLKVAFISGLYSITTYRTIIEFAKNFGKQGPTEVLVVHTEKKISAYIYLFPDEKMRQKYLAENDYTDFNFNDKLKSVANEC